MSTRNIEKRGRALPRSPRQFGGAVVGAGRGWRVGSGVLIAPGKILTAARHAAAEGTTVTLADGSRTSADVAGVDRERGVAVLNAETGDAAPLEWAPADIELGIGTPLYALANGFVDDFPMDRMEFHRLRSAIEPVLARMVEVEFDQVIMVVTQTNLLAVAGEELDFDAVLVFRYFAADPCLAPTHVDH